MHRPPSATNCEMGDRSVNRYSEITSTSGEQRVYICVKTSSSSSETSCFTTTARQLRGEVRNFRLEDLFMASHPNGAHF